MARPRKDGKKVSFFLNAEIVERFKNYCDDKGQTQTLALERILEDVLTHYEKEKYIKANKAKLKRQGFEYDEATGDLIYIEPIEYLQPKEPKEKPKRKKKTPTNFKETGLIEEYGFFGGGEQNAHGK